MSRLPHALRPRHGRNGYLLLLVLGLILATSVIGVHDLTSLVGLFGLYVALATFGVTGAPLRLRVLGYAAGSVTVVAGVAADVSHSDDLRGVAGIAAAAFTLMLIVAMLRDLARVTEVTLATASGLVVVYLLIGLMFGQAAAGIHAVDPSAFRADFGPLDGFDFIYYSYVTLATLGYGDITPAIGLTQALAVMEGVGGQLFLVTVVARVVSTMSAPRRRRPGGPGEEPPGE